jgi:hypothetical protein
VQLSSSFILAIWAHKPRTFGRDGCLFAALCLLLFTLLCSPMAAATSVPSAKSTAALVDLSGHLVDPFANSTNKASVFVFVSTDCPISNRYAPEIQRLQERFAQRGVGFWLVYPNRSDSDKEIRAHLAQYRYAGRAIRDPEHWLVKKASVRVTPEAAVFVGSERVYHGRIDNLFADFGKQRVEATTHELADVLESILVGKRPSVTEAPAVGCYIQE